MIALAYATLLAGAAPMVVTASSSDPVQCGSDTNTLDIVSLAPAGFHRISARVQVKSIVDSPPVLVIQQKAADGSRRTNWMMLVHAPSGGGRPWPPLFTLTIQDADGTGKPVASSPGDQVIWAAEPFDLTITNGADGKLTLSAVWTNRRGEPVSVEVQLPVAPLATGPVALMCAAGTFDLTNVVIQ